MGVEASRAIPERVLRNTPHTASVTFYADGVAVDPGTVAVTVTRDNGDALTSGNASGTGTNARTFALTTTHTASLDILKMVWTSSTYGSVTTYVEVVGGFLFSISQARLLKPLDNTSTYTAAGIADARTLAEMALEDACGIAFVPRYGRGRFDGSGTVNLLLPPRTTAVTAATVTGTALTAGELADLEFYDSGVLYNPLSWETGRRNVTVTYTHGYAVPPPRVGRACLLLAKRFLVDSPIHDRATSVTTDDGTTSFFVTAGVRDAIFDVPEANAVAEEYGVRFGVA